MGPRNARRLAAGFAVLALGLTACAEDAGGDSTAEDQSGPIKIGAVLDITGAGATLGVPERKTLEMLAKQVTAAGGIGGRAVELVIEDNQSTEDGAAKAVNKLVSQDKVDLIIGASRTGPSLAMRPIAESAKIPMISLAANAKIVDGSQWVFKTAQNDKVVLEDIVDQAVAKGWKSIALIRDSSGFGEGIGEMLTELGAPQGIKVVRTEKFAPDATDFTAQMVNIRNAKADANLIWGIPPAAGLAQKAYKQLGVTGAVIQSHGIGNQAFLDSAGPSADGLTAPLGRLLVADQLTADDPQKKVIEKFVADYKAAYPGESPSTFAGHAYDAFQLAVTALGQVGTDGQKLRDQLEGVKGFAGVSGVFTMSATDHSGLDKHALAIVTVENGAWKLLDANR
ncbi:MAG TPA: ABC transporter substrate-binding protein [Kribbella sp.]|uniref:ABC transporter substrate-binding protein n=1 Tax=Kribbella sp. TaxID=1871183 RepID=UPI002D7797FF|nr:ABC transporter substrate-binding protein [Kribbella sp.]HET6294430.1 ABC transporter substrate-binding protein [Kribbella sp.]